MMMMILSVFEVSHTLLIYRDIGLKARFTMLMFTTRAVLVTFELDVDFGTR